MAVQGWEQEKYKVQQENRLLKQQLMISASPNPGPAPVRPEDIPTVPSSPYEKGKSPHKLAGLQINPNTILLPKEPKEAETDEDYGEGEVGDGWKLSHGEDFGESGEIIQDPGFGIDPRGNPIRLPHMEQSPEEQERNKELHEWKFHDGPEPELANVNYGLPTERDKWLKLFQGPGGSLRNIKDPDLRKLILQRGAMKADASNNIRSLQSSGHQTVLDDNRPGQLKIIKQFKPPKA